MLKMLQVPITHKPHCIGIIKKQHLSYFLARLYENRGSYRCHVDVGVSVSISVTLGSLQQFFFCDGQGAVSCPVGGQVLS